MVGGGGDGISNRRNSILFRMMSPKDIREGELALGAMRGRCGCKTAAGGGRRKRRALLVDIIRPHDRFVAQCAWREVAIAAMMTVAQIARETVDMAHFHTVVGRMGRVGCVFACFGGDDEFGDGAFGHRFAVGGGDDHAFCVGGDAATASEAVEDVAAEACAAVHV